MKIGNLKIPDSINKILIIWLSWAGKTTAFDCIKDSLNSKIFPVRRWITRPRRFGDNLDENLHISYEDLVKEWDKIDIQWERDMGDGRIELYAFPKKETHKICLYPWNNFIFSWGLSHPFFINTVIINISSAYKNREQRFIERSHDVVKKFPQEFQKRISSEELSPDFYHFNIENNSSLEDFYREIKKCLAILL